MAVEGLGLAASVAGLVSLGLQITNGIVKYVDGFEARDEELDHAKRQNVTLTATLSAIQTSSISLQGRHPEFIDALLQGVQACKDELGAADALLVELVDENAADWRVRLEKKKKQWTYAFRRSKIQQLSDRIRQANETLQLILSGLGLEISRLNGEKLTAIEASSRDSVPKLLSLHSKFTIVETTVSNIGSQLPALHNEIERTAGLVASHSEMIGNTLVNNHDMVQQELADLRKWMERQFIHQQEKVTKVEKHLRTFRHKNESGVTHDTLVRRAAAKPAAFKELCHGFFAPEDDQTADDSGRRELSSLKNPQILSRSSRVCICPRVMQTSRETVWRLGHIHFSESRERQSHWPSCPLSKLQGKDRQAVGVKYLGFSRMLQSAIGMTFAWTSGAGGFSISPSFTFYPTVDDSRDPAFRIINIISQIPYHHDRRFLVKIGAEMLAKLFRDKKSHPLSVTHDNENLLHRAISEMGFMLHVQAYQDHFLEIFQTLLDHGVPVFEYNTRGDSPLAQVFPVNDVGKDIRFGVAMDIVKSLIQANPECRLATTNQLHPRHESRSPIHLLWCVELPDYAEAFGCGPLSMAVIRDDIQEVIRLLSQFPASLAERDALCGLSPLHLAANKPRILALLLKAAEPDVMYQRSECYLTVLEAAMLLSHKNCPNGRSRVRCGRRCACVKCIEILIAAGHKARMSNRDGLELHWMLHWASELARRRYAFHMKVLRNGRSEPCSTLDGKRKERKSSKTRTIDIPEDLDAIQEDRNSSYDWVYLETRTVYQAELFHRHGFHPSPSLAHNIWMTSSWYNFSYLTWLIEHDVDLLQQSSPKGSPKIECFGAYLLFLYFGETHRHGGFWYETTELESFHKIHAIVTPRNLRDNCQCHCSEGGCSPFSWMLKGVASPPTIYEDGNISRWAYWMEQYFTRYSFELPTTVPRAAIRWSTFEALNLTHTCCCPSEDIEKPTSSVFYRDDVEEINDEQKSLLELHEKLVAEFEAEASRFLGNGTFGRSVFPRFWSEYWQVRMDEELSKLDTDALSDEEKRGAEEIGVRWCEPPVKLVDGCNPYGYNSVEYVVYELEKMYSDCDESWSEWIRQRLAHYMDG